MPYTPPTRSPASSNANSPILSRNHSYEGPFDSSHRPGLPRSRSAAYIQKHRRSPSIAEHQPAPVTATIHGSTSAIDHGLHMHSPARAQNGNLSSRPHAVEQVSAEAPTTSPGDSSLTSEDDEERGRGKQIQDLADSLKNIVLVKRTGSPDHEKKSDASALSKTGAEANGTISPALTPSARKIAHSRSSSEIQLSKLADVPSQAASSDSEEDELHIKPPMVRKKSGELVKPALRPPSRRRPSSMPGTPTFSKAVHFNEDIEQVRHFLQVDRPSAVSAGSSPVETYDSETEYPFSGGYKSSVTEWEIRLANFPKDSREREIAPVRIERIFLAADQKMLVGVVACANIAFAKHVVARFTFDYWKTTSEVTAEFNYDIRKKEFNDGYDRFNFNIKLADQANLQNKTLFICVRYNVAGQEYWDNNCNMNYQVDFVKKVVPRKVSTSAGAGTAGTIPRSRHAPHSAQPRPRSFPSSNDDDLVSSFEFGAGTTLQDPLSRRSRARGGSIYPTQQRRGSPQTGGAFGTRYDFGASLSAALTRAQSQMGQSHNSPLARAKSSDEVYKMSSLAPRTDAPAVQPVDAPNPAKFSSDRPELGSQEYHDLIQKFCYVRPLR
ncbi:hypothetical protein, variant 2 [Verruconis gallopava]|uniref:CBM21 domain-containing protein n=1 Tax=Verruconis gallopava TaxID=253628 RepID=A0A0D1YII5_9PEZI|nr:hypothetical protein, variant 2 [Verruconis gallopava]KIW00672.1 hypothetical protein, variant 2 [Verruconis gallopava]